VAEVGAVWSAVALVGCLSSSFCVKVVGVASAEAFPMKLALGSCKYWLSGFISIKAGL